MIVLFQSKIFNTYQPVVLVDYTRSDEQWTSDEIRNYVNFFTPEDSKGLLPTTIYSLNYTLEYNHTGINYGQSLKTHAVIVVTNPPIELVTLLNIQQFTSQQNIDSLTQATRSVIDPEVKFPQGGCVIKQTNGDPITRRFIVYSTPYQPDAKRVNSTLTIHGGSFDSMVMRLRFAVNIVKTQPLLTQLNAILTQYGFTVISFGVDALNPVLAKYYAPATIEQILQEICTDNNIAFDIRDKQVILQSLSPNSPPPQEIIEQFNFANYVQNSKLISTFVLSNYTTCDFEVEPFNPILYSSVAVYDDSFQEGLFANLVTISGRVARSGRSVIPSYRFYILAYKIIDNREKTSIVITGTNNWLISTFKLDKFLEAAVYKNAL